MTGLSSVKGLQSLWRLLREMGCVCAGSGVGDCLI